MTRLPKKTLAALALGLTVLATGPASASWNNGWSNGWNNGWSNGWANGWNNGWSNGWQSSLNNDDTRNDRTYDGQEPSSLRIIEIELPPKAQVE